MRADLFLSRCGHIASRQLAKTLIEEGCVTVDGRILKKPSEDVKDGEHTVTVKNPLRYVGRGGLKLEGALERFGIDVTGKTVLDIGASTGGFTDCLLQYGAARVIAVDSGAGQLANRLREDCRVVSMEHTNARYLTAEKIGTLADFAVMDVSFISATYLLPNFSGWLTDAGEAVCLIKPQFEVGKQMIGKGGIVKEPSAHLFAVEKVLSCGKESGLIPVGIMPSPIAGGDGNREFLVWFVKNSEERHIIGNDDILKVVFSRDGDKI